jgi:NitT/TauT family transport system permease protein
VSRSFRSGKFRTLIDIVLPASTPYLLAGFRLAAGRALIGAVVAEFVAGTGGSGAGLAYQILLAGIQLNIPRLFAALVLITLTGVLLFALNVWLSARVLSRWHESEIGRGD